MPTIAIMDCCRPSLQSYGSVASAEGPHASGHDAHVGLPSRPLESHGSDAGAHGAQADHSGQTGRLRRCPAGRARSVRLQFAALLPGIGIVLVFLPLITSSSMMISRVTTSRTDFASARMEREAYILW